MNCTLAQEFVSALCDRERIPREAAQHISECETCRGSMKEYAEIGAELRCTASLEPLEETSSVPWQGERQGAASRWWHKSWQTARIPRLAVALMLVAIAGLSSGVLILKAHAAAARQILVLTIKASNGYGDGTTQCTMLTGATDGSPCYLIQALHSGTLGSAIRIVKRNGDNFDLGVRYKLLPNETGPNGKLLSPSLSYPFKDLALWSEQVYSLVPGQEQRIEIAGAGTLTFGIALPDPAKSIVSSSSARFMPDRGELRLISPVLLQGKTVVVDGDGLAASVHDGNTGAVYVYFPGMGRFVISLYPLDGAFDGRIDWTRIRFQMNGKPYQFVTGSPVADAERVYILRDPNYRPSMESPGARDDQPFIGASDLEGLKLAPKQKVS